MKKYSISFNHSLELGIFNDYDLFLDIKSKYYIYPTAIGSIKSHPKQNKVQINPFTLSLIELFILNEKDVLDEETKTNFEKYLINLKDIEPSKYKNLLIEACIISKLNEKGFYCLSGLKYGADYLVYSSDPQITHSEYMLIISYNNSNDYNLLQCERIAQNTKKSVLIGYIKDNNKEEVGFYEFKWKNI